MISFKTYNYPSYKIYYLTVCGFQFGPPLFSLGEVDYTRDSLLAALRAHNTPVEEPEMKLTEEQKKAWKSFVKFMEE